MLVKDQIRFFWKVSFFWGGGVRGTKIQCHKKLKYNRKDKRKKRDPYLPTCQCRNNKQRRFLPNQKKRFTLHAPAKRLMYYPVELPFQEDKTNRNRESPRIPTKHRKVQPIKLALRQSQLNPT